MRTVICHYHIFKNSGTTFDALLTENYADRHISFDGPFPFFSINQIELRKIIARHKKVIAFSSHQLQLPVPVSLDFNVLPVVFFRHPLLRAQSIYNYKRKIKDGTVTSNNARNMSFNDWIDFCLSDRQEITHISNAQTRFIGAAYEQKTLSRNSASGIEYDISQAIRNLANVRLLARTEYFDNDVGKFPEILDEYGITFKFKNIKPRNTTSKDISKPLDERIQLLRQSVSDLNYRRLVDANEQDLYLFEHVTNLLQ